jgi:predicted dehydrogenase
MAKILLVGCGYWGKNWYNTILNSSHELVGVVDPNPVIEVQVPLFNSINEVNIEYTHAIIATNAELHLNLRNQLRCPDKNILIEKPCGIDTDKHYLQDCFPGYIFLSSPQFKHIKQILEENLLGEIIYSRFERASMGPRIRTDVSIIEDYAIHDLYLYLALFEHEQIGTIESNIVKSFNNEIQPDTLFLTIKNQNHIATFFSSWRYPNKTRKIEIVGKKGSIIWENDKVVLSLSYYQELEGYDSYRNKGYNLVINEPVEIEFKNYSSNLHLQLEDFIEGVDRSKIFTKLNTLIYYINKNS